MANHIRNYFGDGSELRRADALRDRGGAARHRGFGAQRDGRARRDVPRDLRRRAHRRRSRRDRRSAPRRSEAFAIDRAEAGREPGRLRHRDHPRRRPRSSGSSRSPRGARCSPTRSTPASTCSTPACSSSSPRARSSTSPATCSRRCSSAGCRCSAPSSTATGRTSARSSRTAPRTRTSSTVRSSIELPGFQLRDGVWIGEGVDVSPDAIIEGPVLVGDNSPRRGRRGAAPVHRARRRRRREGRRAHRAHRRARPRATSGTRPRLRGAVIGRANDIREHVHIEEGVVIGDECFVGARRDRQPGGEDLPVQDGRGRRARHVVDRVGEQGRAHALRPPRRARSRQRRHHVRGRGPPRDGVRHRAQEGLGRVHEPRHEPRRRARSSGRSSRAQPERRARDGPRARRPCRSRGSRCAASGRRAGSRCGSRPTIPTASRSASSTRRAPTSTRATQRKIERLLYREDFRRAFAGDIGDIMFPPRALEFYTAALERSVDGDRLRQPLVQGRARLLVRRGVGRDAARAAARSAPRCSAVNPYAATRRRRRSTTSRPA